MSLPLEVHRSVSPAPSAGTQKRPVLALASAKLSDQTIGDRSAIMSPSVLRGCARLLEFALVAAVGFAIAVAYIDETGVAANPRYLAALLVTGLLTTLVFELLGLYNLRTLSSFILNMPRVVLGWTSAFAALVVAIFLLKMGSDISRVWLTAWYLTGTVALLAARVCVGWTVRHWAASGRLYQRAAIYGVGPVGDDLIAQLENDPDHIVRIVGIFDDRAADRSLIAKGYPRLGGIQNLIAFSRNTRLDLVILALPLTAEDRLAGVAKALSVLPADIKLAAKSTSLRFSPRTYSHVGSVAMIDLYDKPMSNWGHISKWLFDKIVGLLALILLAPVMTLVAIAVKLDSRGPVLFRQKRYGFNNELIEVYKFRSMYVDRCDAVASKLVTKDDPRVTRVGRIIRKTSLDELPQLFNVLLGDLSIVGPRPHAVQAKAGAKLYDEVVEGYFARHKVKPGITGWAQINGWRGETDTPEKILKRVEHDLYYIENWSVFLDLYILVKTPWALLKAENAY